MEYKSSGFELMLDKIYETIKYNFPQKEIDIFKNSSKSELFQFHFGLGLWLRNNVILGNEELCGLFQQQSICHPDDMSAFILEKFHNRLNEAI